MSNDVKVKGFDSLVKRNKSSIINKDVSEFEAAKNRRKKNIAQQNAIKQMEDVIVKNAELEEKINSLEEKMDLIIKLMSEKK